jgi:hypothetical protein
LFYLVAETLADSQRSQTVFHDQARDQGMGSRLKMTHDFGFYPPDDVASQTGDQHQVPTAKGQGAVNALHHLAG